MQPRKEITRRSFLKLGFAGISASALIFVAGGCAGGGDDDDDDDDDDGGRSGSRHGMMHVIRRWMRHRR
jgi:hypothetical protein